MDDDELLHLQCMLFLPLAIDDDNTDEIENRLFGGRKVKTMTTDRIGRKRLKYRLLREVVDGSVRVDRDHLLTV